MKWFPRQSTCTNIENKFILTRKNILGSPNFYFVSHVHYTPFSINNYLSILNFPTDPKAWETVMGSLIFLLPRQDSNVDTDSTSGFPQAPHKAPSNFTKSFHSRHNRHHASSSFEEKPTLKDFLPMTAFINLLCEFLSLSVTKAGDNFVYI